MLMRALTYQGFIENPDWIYRWNGHEWGANGIAHFTQPGPIVSPMRLVMGHILDRLRIDPDLRDAWCASHADDVIETEFRGEWSKSTPQIFRKRILRPRVGSIWDCGPLGGLARQRCTTE